jgi:hypothetical protein
VDASNGGAFISQSGWRTAIVGIVGWKIDKRRLYEVTLLLGGVASAQVKLPDTPAGKRLAEFMQAVSTGDGAKHKDFVNNSMSKELRERLHIERHLGFLKQVHDNEDSVELEKVEKSSDRELVAILKSRNGGLLRIELTTDQKEPYGINGMRLRPVE